MFGLRDVFGLRDGSLYASCCYYKRNVENKFPTCRLSTVTFVRGFFSVVTKIRTQQALMEWFRLGVCVLLLLFSWECNSINQRIYHSGAITKTISSYFGAPTSRGDMVIQTESLPSPKRGNEITRIIVLSSVVTSLLLQPSITFANDAALLEIKSNVMATQSTTKSQLTTEQTAGIIGKTITLSNGVQYVDAILGNGEEAQEGRSVQFQWVMRRANGYFIDASSKNEAEPIYIYKVGNLNRVIPGLDSGIRGMKVGGLRRIIVPSELAYIKGVELDSPGPVPFDFGPKRQIINIQNIKQNIYFEVKLIKVK